MDARAWSVDELDDAIERLARAEVALDQAVRAYFYGEPRGRGARLTYEDALRAREEARERVEALRTARRRGR